MVEMIMAKNNLKGDAEVVIPTSSVSVTAAEKQQKKSLKKLKVGSTMKKSVLGKEVDFELVIVPAGKVEETTTVFLDNERIQSLLDEMAIADIADSFKEHGQEYPAIGRKIDGVISVAEGSRRRFAAITFKKPYLIWIGDLDDEQMLHLSDVGNQYKGVSAYEKGKKYEKLLKAGTQEEVANAAGISRRMLMKYINTARLPELLIKCLPSPNDLSANEGERLFKLYDSCASEDIHRWLNEKLNDLYEQKQIEKWEAEFVIKTFAEYFITKEEKQNNNIELSQGATLNIKNGNAVIKIPKISDDAAAQIRLAIIKILDQEQLDQC